MNHINVHVHENIEQYAAIKINEYLRKHIKKNVLLLLSAGSSFSLLPLIETKFLSKNTTIGVLDERFDPRDDVNNYLQLKKTDFFVKALERNCSFIDTSINPQDTLLQKAEVIEKYIKTWKTKNPDGIIVITQGIGNDGHTAGIFPFSKENKKQMEELTTGKRWVIGYDVKDKNQFPLRITPTFFFLEDVVNKAFIYVVGEEKREILRSVIENGNQIERLPARIIHFMKNVEIFTNISL